jgi:ell wall binding domain 2 (CWB2)
VFILGGPSAVPSSVDTTLSAMGDKPTRLQGTNRFGTAVAIAGALGNPGTVFEATGLGFADGLSAGAAAAATHGVVLLTNGAAQAPETAAYLAAHAGSHYAIGGPAASADPAATAVTGADRYATAVTVASKFFAGGPTVAGFASGVTFPDALSGGASIGAHGGPLLLVPPSGALPSSLSTYLMNTTSITTGLLYGGASAVGTDVQTEVAAGGSGSGSGGSGQPSGLGFTTALAQWQTGATANAANQHQYWLNAGNYLSADQKTDTNTSGYPAAIAELYQIAGYPSASMLTAQQSAQETSDIAALKTFFGTPGLVVTVT